MRVNGKKIIQRLEALYPTRLAESWDNVGLQVGNDSRVVERILICLEVTDKVVDEAIAKNSDLIIAHHPLIFKGLKTLAETTPQGKMISRIIRENLSVYCMHTNYDMAEGGLNDILASRLGLNHVSAINELKTDSLYKLAVYIPRDSVAKVSDALLAAGAGRMGNYDGCNFVSEGLGSFRPLDGANPTLGAIGQVETVEEVKWEAVVAKMQLTAVLQALHKTHPYETPAYDLFELQTPAKTYGIGRVGQLEAPMSIENFVGHLKTAFEISALRLVYPDFEKKTIRKVALVSGAGMEYVGDAAKMGADVFITGDIKYHEATGATHLGMVLADVGHFESEVIYKHHLKEILEGIVKEQEYDLVVDVSTEETKTFVFA